MKTMPTAVNHYKKMFSQLNYNFPDEVLNILAARDIMNEAIVCLRKHCGERLMVELSAIYDDALSLREFGFTFHIKGHTRDHKADLLVNLVDRHLDILNDSLLAYTGEVNIATFKVGKNLTLAECSFPNNKH